MSKKLFILLCHLNFIFAAQERVSHIYGYDPAAPCEQAAKALAIARAKEAYSDMPEDKRVVPIGPFGYKYLTGLSRFDPKQINEYRKEASEERLNLSNNGLFGDKSIRYNGARHPDPFWVQGERFETVGDLLAHPRLTEIRANLIARAEKERVLYQKHLQERRDLIAQGRKVDETTVTPSGMELDALNLARRKELKEQIDFRNRRKEQNEEKKQKLDEEKELKARALDCVMKQKEKKEQELQAALEIKRQAEDARALAEQALKALIEQEKTNRVLKAAKEAFRIGEAVVRRAKIAVVLGVNPAVMATPVFGSQQGIRPPLGRGLKRGLE